MCFDPGPLDPDTIRKLLMSTAEVRAQDDELARHLKSRTAQERVDLEPELVYDPLLSSRHIRVLTLFPGTLNDPIVCALNQVHVDSQDTIYTALSYAWGDPEQRLPIQCNDATAFITINLYSALLRLRKTDVKQSLWIDALCINQSLALEALEERGRQVKMMNMIFSTAEKVIIDLGGAESKKAKEILDFLTSTNRQMDYNPLAYQLWIDKIDPDSLMLDFSSRPWFGRVWVVQEFAVARRVEIMLGTVTMTEDVFEDYSKLVDKYLTRQVAEGRSLSGSAPAKRMAYMSKIVSFLVALTSLRKTHQASNKSMYLTEMLQMGSICRTSDERDRIYGMLGLLEEKVSSQIAVDYSESSDKLEQRIGNLMIDQGLLHDCLTRGRGFNSGGTSWRPSIIRSRGEQDYTFQIGEIYQLYKACNETRPQVYTTAETNILTVTSAQIDTVQSVSLPNKSYIADIGNMVSITPYHMSQWFKYVRTWVEDHFKEWNTVVRNRVLWQTLVWDKIVGPGESWGRPQNHHEIDADRTPMEKILLSPPSSDSSWQSQTTLVSHYQNLLHSLGMRVCRTAEGRMALVPEKAIHGTEIWIVQGVKVPLALRRVEKGHILVGACYVHGMMDGEAANLASWKAQELHIQ